MPYFLEADGTVVITIGSEPRPALPEVPPLVGKRARLRHGKKVPEVARIAAQSSDWSAFLRAIPEADRGDGSSVVQDMPLPQLGTWEYRVIAVTEVGGFATAQGTAERIEQTLNSMAKQGWELTTSTDREARWIKGESILLTLRRRVVTEDHFRLRFEAEERLRRLVLAKLDQEAVAAALGGDNGVDHASGTTT